MNKDFRARVTKNIIKESYLALLHESKNGMITVTSLCEKAGISRTTFYNHYEYIEDIAEEISDEYIDRLKDLILEYDLDARRILHKVLTEIKNTDDLQLELAAHKSALIDRKISIMVNQLLNERFRVIFGVEDDKLFRMASIYIAAGINAVIGLWINTGFESSVEDVENLLMALIAR